MPTPGSVDEPSRLQPISAQRTALLAPVANPAHDGLGISFSVAADSVGTHMDPSVFDVTGRRITTAGSGAAEMGESGMRWNLTTREGPPVSPGL